MYVYVYMTVLLSSRFSLTPCVRKRNGHNRHHHHLGMFDPFFLLLCKFILNLGSFLSVSKTHLCFVVSRNSFLVIECIGIVNSIFDAFFEMSQQALYRPSRGIPQG